MPHFLSDIRTWHSASLLALLVMLAGCVPEENLPTANSSNYTNTAPTAAISATATTRVGVRTQLSGNGTDRDDDPLSYSWVVTSAPAGSAVTIEGADTPNPSFVPDVEGSYTVQLVVDDGIATAADAVTITAVVAAGSVNSPPVANAGSDFRATLGIEVRLNGGGSDADGDPLSYRWTLISVPEGSSAVLSRTDITNPGFTVDIAGDYTVQLIVNDGTVDSAADTVVISSNAPPVADAGTNRLVPANTTIVLDGSKSNDPDGDALSYRWEFITKPAGSAAVLAGARSAAPSFVADLDGQYIVRLRVNDGMLDSVPVTVSVTTASSSVTISWPANADTPPGYVVYVGPAAAQTDQILRILVRGAADWNPASPRIEVSGDELAGLLPGGSTQACFAVKAYNGVGLSLVSEAACVSLY